MSGPDTIIIELAGEPVGKGRPRFRAVETRDGRKFNQTYTPAHTRKFEDALRARAQDFMGGRAPLNGPLALLFVAAFPVPASWSKKKRAEALAGIVRPCSTPDSDNLLKVTDALNQVAFVDDRQIVDARVVKLYSERPHVRIVIDPVRSAAIHTETVEQHPLPLFEGAA